jgi:uncharacterized membrane protein
VSKEFDYGPVQFLLVGFDGDRPNAGVIDAIKDLLESDTIRLLDLLLIAHSDDGVITATEIEDLTDEYGFGSIELEASGVATDDDIQEFGASIPPGTSAAFAVIEYVWAKHLASKLAESGGFLIGSEFIPAPVVNAELAAVAAEE